MDDLNWTARSPLEAELVAGGIEGPGGEAGVQITEVREFGLLQILARRGRWPEVATAGRAFFDVEAPGRPGVVQARDGLFIWSGADQFFFLFSRVDVDRKGKAARDAFAGMASVSEQSDSRCFLRVSGQQARDMLASLCSLDLHDSVFPVGAAAVTSIDHNSVILWREPDQREAVFAVLMFQSFAVSLCRTLLSASARYGVATAVE